MIDNYGELRSGTDMHRHRPKSTVPCKYEDKNLAHMFHNVERYLEYTALNQYHVSKGIKVPEKEVALVSKELKQLRERESLKLRWAAYLSEEENAAVLQYLTLLKENQRVYYKIKRHLTRHSAWRQ